MYTVYDSITKGKAEFYLLEGENLLDKLEEVLYICYELEPDSRDWKREFHTHGKTQFSYHHCAPTQVIYMEDIHRFVLI